MIVSLQEQENDLNDGGTHDQVRSQGFYRSLSNVLIALADQAVNEANRFKMDVKRDFRAETVKLTAKTIAWSPVALLWDVLNGSPYLSQFATHIPDVVPWLQAFIDWWKHLPRN